MEIDENRWITQFHEKPQDPPVLKDSPDSCLASMGIYIFNSDYLYKMLEDDSLCPSSSNDFGKDIIPKIVARREARSSL